MEKGSQKMQADQWICRGFLRTLDPQEMGADREKNRSVQVLIHPEILYAVFEKQYSENSQDTSQRTYGKYIMIAF